MSRIFLKITARDCKGLSGMISWGWYKYKEAQILTSTSKRQALTTIFLKKIFDQNIAIRLHTSPISMSFCTQKRMTRASISLLKRLARLTEPSSRKISAGIYPCFL